MLEIYLDLADSYSDNGLFGVAQEIAEKVLCEIDSITKTREIILINAHCCYLLGISAFKTCDYVRAATQQLEAKKLYESVAETGLLYSNILFEYAHATWQLGWIPNIFLRIFIHISAKAANIFKSLFLKPYLRNELLKTPKYVEIIKAELGDKASGISDERQLLKLAVDKIVSENSGKIDLSEAVTATIITVAKGRKLCRDIITFASDRTVAATAYEMLALSYRNKKKELALSCVENSIKEIEMLSKYKKHSRYSFSYRLLGIWCEDKEKLDQAFDIALTRYENDHSVFTLIDCISEYANKFKNDEKFEQAIPLYKEILRLSHQLQEINQFELKDYLNNLSYCYEKQGDSSNASYYKSEAEKYSSISVGISSYSQTNIIKNLDCFLKSESIRTFYNYNKFTLHDLKNDDSFIEYENSFIKYVNRLIESLEKNEVDFREFRVCHKTLISIISGEQNELNRIIGYRLEKILYAQALDYRDGVNGKDKDARQSFDMLLQASYIGSKEAKTELGLLYSVNPDYADIYESVFDYREVEELHLSEEERIKIAKKYWKEASLLGDARAMFLMGEYYYRTNNYSNAELWLDLSSERGYIPADYILAKMYSDTEHKHFFSLDDALNKFQIVATCSDQRYKYLADASLEAISSLEDRFMFYKYMKSIDRETN
jgi:TPR repeat protein